MLDMFVRYPFLALMPAAFFALTYFICRQRLVLFVTNTWLVYFAYELTIKLKLICSGECNIRVDLLLLYPFLAILSIMGFIAFLKSIAKQK